MRSGIKELEVNWKEKAKTWKRVETLVRKAATKVNWEPEIVWGLVQDYWENGGSAYNDKDLHFGFQIDWWEDGDIFIYMYAKDYDAYKVGA